MKRFLQNLSVVILFAAAAVLACVLFYQDERYTSFEAEEYLKEARIPWEKRKTLLDKVAAQIILQNYLDERK